MRVDAVNAAALAKRQALPAANNLSPSEFNAFPPYFGWVKCDSGHGSFTMFLGGTDDGIAQRFFWNGSYEKTTLELWSRLAKTCQLALDVGAHTGVYTLAAKMANPDISVAAFEPNPTNFVRLCLNMRVNNLHLRNASMAAVGDKDEILPFSVPANSVMHSAGGMVGTKTNALVYQTQVIALDTSVPVDAYPLVGLVKIDTEGYEDKVIEGMKGIIAVAKPIIFFECIGASGAAVQALLEPFRYRFFEIDDELGTIDPVATVRPYFDADGQPIHNRANRIAVPESKTLGIGENK